MSLSNQTWELTRKYVEAGAHIHELARLFSVSSQTMRARLHRIGLKPNRPPVSRPELQYQTNQRDLAMCRAYADGKTLQEVGDQYGLTRERVRQILCKNNVKDRRLWKKPEPPKFVPLTDEQFLARQKARFWTYVNITTNPDECWNWLRPSTSIHPYPRYSSGFRKSQRTSDIHRLAYEYTYGKPTKWVLHKCDNPRCANPNHLYEGTAKNNAQDRERNRNKNGRRRLTWTEAEVIRQQIASGSDVNVVAAAFRVCNSTVYRISKGLAFTGKFRAHRTPENIKIIQYIWNNREVLSISELMDATGYLRSMISAIWNGYTWNDITGLPKKISPKRSQRVDNGITT